MKPAVLLSILAALMPAQGLVKQGETVFSKSCATGYCHGARGTGGGAPRIAARGFDQELIPSERFYAGGGTSVRGFAEDGLGARGLLGDPEGGNGLLVFNQEMRVRPHRWFGAVAFIDAGNVFPRARDISFTKLEAGAGFGLRVISPFAILRVDFGMAITSRKTQPAGRWYFGIGHTF